MDLVEKRKNRKLLGFLAVLLTSLLTFALVIANGGIKSPLFGAKGGLSYTLTLNSSNAVSSAGTYDKQTARGASVAFTYANVSGSSGKHVRLNNGGTLVNHDQITSIESITTNFTLGTNAKLTLKTSYDGATWGDAWEINNNETYFLSSHPYYAQFTATGGYVDISSVVFQYSCVANPDATPTEIPGEYIWTRVSSLNDLVQGDEVLIVGRDEASTSDGYFTLNAELMNTYYIKGYSVSLTNSNENAEASDTNTVWTVYNGSSSNQRRFKSGSNYFYAYTSGTHYNVGLTTSNSSTSDITVSFDNSKSASLLGGGSYAIPYVHSNSGKEFKGSSTRGSNPIYIYKHVPGPSTYEYDIPVDAIGFTAADSNKNTYTTNSIFANDNALVVKALYNNGDQIAVPCGENGYSYEIRNAQGVLIDPTQKFPAEGTYTLTVSYGNFIPQEITLNVGEYIYVTDISVNITDNEFNTADTMSQHLTGNVTALVGYNNGNETEITYANFAANNLGVKLLTPKGFSYDMSTPFGSDGTWKLRVYSMLDESIKGDINVFVAAIPVTSITMNDSAVSIAVEGTHQLIATVGPNNATNTAVVWESNNTEVATVDQNGLVTAINVGKANITATAADGSGIVGTCSVTVTAKPQETTETLTITIDSFTNASTAYAWYNWSQATSDSTTISGKGEIYKAADASDMQFNKGKGNKVAAIYNSVAVPGSITKIEAKTGSGTNRNWNAYVSSTAYSASGSTLTQGSNSTTIGSNITVDTTTTSLGTSTSGYSYFCLQEVTTSASFLAEIVITYSSTSSTPVSPVYPTGISLSGTNSISIGGTSQLEVAYTPSDTNVKNVTWSSSNSSVATVSNSGLVTGVAAGTARITATAEAESGTVSSYIDIQVTTIAVTGITLDVSSASVKVGKTTTIVANVTPSNATNKTINWTTSSGAIATVSGGVVTGVGAGTATITATTADGGFSKTCVVTVTASSTSGWELVTSASSLAAGDVIVLANYAQGVTNGNISSQIMGSVTSTFSSDHSAIEELGEDTVVLTLGGSEGAWTLANDQGELLGATAVKKLAWDSGTTTWEISISGGDATIQSTTESYGKFLYNVSNPRFTTYTSSASSTMLMPQIYRGGTAEPTNPTSIILSKTSAELSPNGSVNLSVSYVPSNANQNKELTWTSSNSNVATVDSTGKVTAKSTATEGQTATITARLTNLPSITATCTISIVATKNDDHTVMIYLCGADLESGTDDNGNVPSAANASGYASSDLDEILKVSNQPDDVNIIVETGGANIWQSGHSYSISNSKLERWHVENKTLVKDSSLTYASMGLESTFRSFLEWGLNNYPADRVGVILWNHGGGMHGVCYDEKKSDDNLLNNEVKSAVSGALSNCGMSGQKLEWIGYDACLMAVQDIAEFNSPYFNYQVSSEESEAGYGWDYDNWVDNLYAKQSTPAILKEICDTFIADNGGVNKKNGDQTLSYLNLAHMSSYKTAWENMAAQLKNKLTSSNKSAFNSAIISNVKHYADNDYDYFCLFDAIDFINKLASNSSFSNYRIDSSYTTAVTNAFNNLLGYNIYQTAGGNSNGLCMYWPNSSSWSYISTYYTTTQTNFTEWQSLCNTYGTHK